MRRWTIRVFLSLGALVFLAALTGAIYQWLATRRDLRATAPPGQLVDIGGYPLHVWCAGNGTPAVILYSGLGGTSAEWRYVQRHAARFTQVCSDDRAGGSALNGAAPVDPVSGIIDAFATYPIVAFGEDHGNQQGHALRLQLVRDPRFAATVNDIVVEFGDALYQKVIDRFIEGEDVPDPILRRVWQDTTMPHPIWDRPIYEEFFRAVRSVNTALPAGRRLRVLLGDPPIDWTRVRSAEDIKHVQTTLGRDRFPAHLVLEEVLAKNRRALVIYGGAHLWRQNLTGTTLVERIEAGRGHTVFTVLSHPFANFGVVVPDISSWQAPSLALTRGTALENQVDAVLYLGPASAMTRSRLSRALCADPAYREMRRRRMALVMKDADEVLRAECGEGLSK